MIQQEVMEKKKAYLVIERCEDEFFDALLMRVTHQAVRNGATWVFVTDKESQRCGTSRIVENKDYGYYRFTFAHQIKKIKNRKTGSLVKAIRAVLPCKWSVDCILSR